MFFCVFELGVPGSTWEYLGEPGSTWEYLGVPGSTTLVSPIVLHLKEMADSDVEDLTRKLGNKKLRNHDSMRKFIAFFFVQYDQNSPLDSLIKFIAGDLPALDS